MKDPIPLEEAIRVGDQWYVLATSSRAGDPGRVLKHGDTFALFDRFGDMPRAGTGEHGVYHQGTRFLSRHELRLAGQRPVLLNSVVRRDNGVLVVEATNGDLFVGDELMLRRGTVHVSRSWMLREAAAHERVEVANYGTGPLAIEIAFEFAADYADIFEVRGYERERRGEDLAPRVGAEEVVLGYRGLDGVTRRTRFTWSAPPSALDASRVAFEVALAPHARLEIEAVVACEVDSRRVETVDFAEAWRRAQVSIDAAAAERASLTTSNAQFNAWIERSAADLYMLTAGNPEGRYPYAGVPWYSVPFGRDGILTALQYLWVDPSMARGVLHFLAETQASEVRPEQDAEPGKIVHEMRKGELAALGEIPFGRYYGTIDATPLFVILAGEYFQRTADRETLERTWPHVERALEWMRRYGDADGDGFIEYERRSRSGLANQGWKDSEDAIFHADGALAEGPIALCEVQGYAYLARLHAARLARVLGHREEADILEREARALHAKFEEAFWCEELGTYALALDGAKRPCKVRSSNAGHLLWSGIASPERAKRVGRTLLAASSFSGWGIRTVADSESRYNPMSYHNGSIWPHDNAVIAMGLARYGMKAEAAAIATAMYEASLAMDLHRLPELFCGFERRAHAESPTLYPVACSPQAWASGSVFYLAKACLGLSFRPEEPRIRFLNPTLPACLDALSLRGIRAGDAVVDVHFERHDEAVGVKVVRRRGEVAVSVVQ
ncbi:MAG TPA: amylo-alpha-1,6-glucosidase [Usitatibacter sp.]|nr:amylo-alpha-1,6-glucosidase [Usitatibacter sp.]